MAQESNNLESVSFATARKIAVAYLKNDWPVFLWGPPGIGKSHMVKSLAKAAGAMVIDIRLSMFDPVDLRGLPAIVDGKTVWLKPAFWPEHSDKLIFLFFDELDRASAAVKNAALQIVLDRRIGEHELPRNVRIFAAGNGTSDKGFAGTMGTAGNDRFAHIELRPDVDSWLDFATRSNYEPGLIAFIMTRGRKDGRPTPVFYQDNPARDCKAFPTNRSWSQVNKLLKSGIDRDIRYHAVSGIVGNAAALELESFLEMFEALGDIMAEIWASPATAHVFPVGDVNKHFAIAVALADQVRPETMAAMLAYAQRMPREYEILAVTSATKRNPELKNCRAFVDYAARNQHVFATA